MSRRSNVEAEWMSNTLDNITGMCDTIAGAHGCERCPLFGTCLEDSNFIDIACAITAGLWQDFFDYAEVMSGYVSEEDREAMYWDTMRDRDIDMLLEEQYDRTDEI